MCATKCIFRCCSSTLAFFKKKNLKFFSAFFRTFWVFFGIFSGLFLWVLFWNFFGIFHFESFFRIFLRGFTLRGSTFSGFLISRFYIFGILSRNSKLWLNWITDLQIFNVHVIIVYQSMKIPINLSRQFRLVIPSYQSKYILHLFLIHLNCSKLQFSLRIYFIEWIIKFLPSFIHDVNFTGSHFHKWNFLYEFPRSTL